MPSPRVPLPKVPLPAYPSTKNWTPPSPGFISYGVDLIFNTSSSLLSFQISWLPAQTWPLYSFVCCIKFSSDPEAQSLASHYCWKWKLKQSSSVNHRKLSCCVFPSLTLVHMFWNSWQIKTSEWTKLRVGQSTSWCPKSCPSILMEVSSGTTQAGGHSTTNILVHLNILPSKYSSKNFSIHIFCVGLLMNLASNEYEGRGCHEEKNTIYKKVKVQTTHDK